MMRMKAAHREREREREYQYQRKKTMSGGGETEEWTFVSRKKRGKRQKRRKGKSGEGKKGDGGTSGRRMVESYGEHSCRAQAQAQKQGMAVESGDGDGDTPAPVGSGFSQNITGGGTASGFEVFDLMVEGQNFLVQTNPWGGGKQQITAGGDVMFRVN